MKRIRAIATYSLLWILTTVPLVAQESPGWVSEHIDLNGYIKFLNTTAFRSLDSLANDNLLHNRINLKVYANDAFTAVLEVRNRVFWGTSVQNIPGYASLVDTSVQDIDLSALVVNEPALVALSNIDRLYADFHFNKWQIIVGRQRINWGKNLVWNPNDLFNAYNFIDFDYEERPGADALRVQYYTTASSSLEAAVNYADRWDDNTFALKYNFHRFDYDFQVLAGKYREDLVTGLGWEGALGNMGFKGEMSYFTPQHQGQGSAAAFVGSVSLDYYFKNGLLLYLSTLYNGNGITKTGSFEISQLDANSLDAKNLMPNRWSWFAQVSDALTPAINTELSVLYARELQALLLMPQFAYQLAQNWDFDITAQLFYGEQDATFSTLGNRVFLRFRYSF